jgi:hypothetical protein
MDIGLAKIIFLNKYLKKRGEIRGKMGAIINSSHLFIIKNIFIDYQVYNKNNL